MGVGRLRLPNNVVLRISAADHAVGGDSAQGLLGVSVAVSIEAVLRSFSQRDAWGGISETLRGSSHIGLYFWLEASGVEEVSSDVVL